MRKPRYEWTCLACGQANAAADSRCPHCECPSSASEAQIRYARQRYVIGGGALQSSAAALAMPNDWRALGAFAKFVRWMFWPVWLLIGLFSP